MRFVVQHDSEKQFLSVKNYKELIDEACKKFNFRPHEACFFYVDMSGAGEIPINSEEDYLQMTSDIEEAIARGNKAKPVILLKKMMESFLWEISGHRSIAA